MRVRCKATADYRSNAVGVVELESTPEGLCVALLGVSSYREGYAPGPLVQSKDVCIPWAGVYATRIGEHALLLSMDAKVLPQNRLLLGDFEERRPDNAADGRARRVFFVTLGVAVLGALGVALSRQAGLPHREALRTLSMAALIVAVLTLAVRRFTREPRLSPHEVLQELSYELSQHLPNHIPMELAVVPPRAIVLPALSGALPRSVVGVAVTLAATTLAALVGSSAARPKPQAAGLAPLPTNEPARSEWFGSLRGAAPAPAPAEPAPAEPSPAPDARERATFGAACGCARDESRFGGEPLPRVSPLVLGRRASIHDGHRYLELDLGLVNNGNLPAAKLDLSVVFFEETTGQNAGQRTTGERPLYFEGPLAPGGIIRWHVEGRGTSFDVIPPDLGTLAADGSDAAPGDAWDTLAAAGSRTLELHAVRLLAFLGDGRAQSRSELLRRTASDSEEAYLDRLARPPPPVATCSVDVRREDDDHFRLEACLDNHSAEPRERLALRLLAYDAPLSPERAGARLPEVLAEHTTVLRETLAPRAGRKVSLLASFPLEEAAVPRAFEVVVDREEYLR